MILTWIRACMSMGALLVALSTSAANDSIAPDIGIFPNPVCAGDTVYVEVSGMPSNGTWSISVSYSDGTTDTPSSVTDEASGTARSCVPAGAAGGSVMVTVEMDGHTESVSKPVRKCP